MTENVTLKDGTVLQCRPVPPHAAIAIHSEYNLPQPPALPMKQQPSKAGHSEPLPIGPGDEGWDEFREARDEWQVEYQRIKDEISKRESEFVLDFSIVAWKRLGDDEWQTDPPEDWEFPAVLLRHEITPSSNLRLDYIKYELLQSADDIYAMQEVAVGNTHPLTREEVDASRGKFRAEDETRRGGAGDSETEDGRDAHIQHHVLPRDESGKGIWAFARRLVQRIKR